jgi:fermentation-respiration switch protein FrsA (DUF1100 family)
VLPVIAHSRVRDAGVAVFRLLGRLPMRPGPSMTEVARGYGSLAESTARTAFVHTLRSVVEPGGQRVHAGDLLYLGEGRPTLIVWGARDTVIPVAHAYEAQQSIQGSVLELFERSGHFPHMDEPTRFVRVMLHFLDSTEPVPMDRAQRRNQMTKRSEALREQRARDEAAALAATEQEGPAQVREAPAVDDPQNAN